MEGPRIDVFACPRSSWRRVQYTVGVTGDNRGVGDISSHGSRRQDFEAPYGAVERHHDLPGSASGSDDGCGGGGA